MRRLIATLAFSVMYFVTYAQFINDGATITIQSGATLRIESDFQNNGTGILTNNGTLEVSGNFTNAATAVLTSSVGLVKFIGTGNTNLDTGGDVLNNVEMAKTTSTGTLTLIAPASINGNLSFTGTGNNKILIGNYDITMTGTGSSVTATTDHPTNGWVVTDKTGLNTGKFIKNVVSGSSTKTLEIGDDTNYSPVTMAINASSVGTVGARVLTTNLTPKYTESSDFINREWVVSTTNITSNTLTGNYVAGDIIGSQSLIKGATYHTSDWRFDGSSGSGNTVTASITNSDVRFSGKNFFGKANLKVYLYNVTGGTMNDYLRTLTGQFPLTDPFTLPPYSTSGNFNYIPSTSSVNTTQTILDNNNIVDWIFVELRNGSLGSTNVVFSKSGLLKSDGTIINPSGTPFSFKNMASGNYYIAIKHRNHIGFMTSGVSSFPSTSLINLTDGSVSMYGSDPLRLVSSGIYSMWTGDGNADTSVDSGDLNGIYPINGSIVDEYNKFDVNLDGSVDSGDLNIIYPINGAVMQQID
jgi:hypothetical protein